MKTSQVVWGMLLLCIGVVLLLVNLDLAQFDWGTALRFWPLAIVVAGIKYLLPPTRQGNILAGLVAVAAIACFLYAGFDGRVGDLVDQNLKEKVRRVLKGSDENRSELRSLPGQTTVMPSYKEESERKAFVEKIKLLESKITLDSVNLELTSTVDSYVFYAHSHETNKLQKVIYNVGKGDSIVHMNFTSTRGRVHKRSKDAPLNNLHIGFHRNPRVRLHLTLKNSTAHLDLRQIQCTALNLYGDQVEVKAELGALEGQREMVSHAQDSRFAFSIPSELSVKMVCNDSAQWSGTNLDIRDLELMPDGSYQTAGFEQAQNRYLILFEKSPQSLSVSKQQR